MSVVQHYLRAGESLQSLEDSYKVPWQDIADATFGGHTTNLIYDYLSTHGGEEYGSYPSHSSGSHWGFATGMVAEIPGVSSSLSPVPAGAATFAAGGAVDDVPEWSGGDQVFGPSAPSESSPVNQAAVSDGGGMIPILIGLLVVGLMFSGKKKPTRRKPRKPARKPRKRAPARRRRR